MKDRLTLKSNANQNVVPLDRLASSKISSEKYFAKGKRGMVYLAKWKGKTVIVKRANPSSLTVEGLMVSKEAEFLRIANKHNIGPRLYYATSNEIGMEYIKGDRILDFLAKADAKQIKTIINKTLQQCRSMDELGINKRELTNPYKHIIIRKKRIQGSGMVALEPVMIDFERCQYTQKPKNVTQFLQFLGSGLVVNALSINRLYNKKGFKLSVKPDYFWLIAKEYKNNQTTQSFNRILKAVETIF
jgi:putative serine/threonine protein kinase